MELHFFKEFLMISHPTTVFLLLVFLLILAMIHHLEKKGTSFGKLVTIGTVSGALLGIFIQVPELRIVDIHLVNCIRSEVCRECKEKSNMERYFQ